MNKKFFVALMGMMLLASIIGGISVDTFAHHVYGDYEITRWCNYYEQPGGGWLVICTILWDGQTGLHTSQLIYYI